MYVCVCGCSLLHLQEPILYLFCVDLPISSHAFSGIMPGDMSSNIQCTRSAGQKCPRTIPLTATVERGSCMSLDSPPCTYPHVTHSSGSRDYVNVISNQDDSTRREFVIQQVAVKENAKGAILVQNEELVEGCCGTFNDATSQTSIDIGFPPPIPPQTPAMFLVQTCEPTDHNTIHIPMRTNLSYNELGSGTVQD